MIVLIFVCSPTNNNYYNLFCYFLITMTYFNSTNYHAVINCYCYYMYCCVYIVVVVIVFVVVCHIHISLVHL